MPSIHVHCKQKVWKRELEAIFVIPNPNQTYFQEAIWSKHHSRKIDIYLSQTTKENMQQQQQQRNNIDL